MTNIEQSGVETWRLKKSEKDCREGNEGRVGFDILEPNQTQNHREDGILRTAGEVTGFFFFRTV